MELPPGSRFRKKKNQILDWEYDIKELFNSTPTTVSLVKNVNETASAFAFRELLKANQIPFDEKANEELKGLSRKDSLLKLLARENLSLEKTHFNELLIFALNCTKIPII